MFVDSNGRGVKDYNRDNAHTRLHFTREVLVYLSFHFWLRTEDAMDEHGTG